jgi:hypothetical protein
MRDVVTGSPIADPGCSEVRAEADVWVVCGSGRSVSRQEETFGRLPEDDVQPRPK